MGRNVYFTQGTSNEQYLLEDLIIESLQIYGNDFFYIPRQLVAPDNIFGEDRLSEFKEAFDIEMYFEQIDSFGGQGSFIAKFGLMIEQSATLVVAKRRWEQLIGRFESTIIPERPCEGDLIYFPLSKGLFEIKYVEHRDPFYQLGKLYVYKLQVELFQYSSETIDTGIDDIDVFEDLKSFDPDINPELQQTGFGDNSEFKERASEVIWDEKESLLGVAMFGDRPQYFGVIKNSIVAFGNLFSNIHIERKEGDSVTGNTIKRIKVPLEFTNKEKWMVRLAQDPTMENQVYTTLPRMGFEIQGYTYDSVRKVGKMQMLRCGHDRVYSPAPYIIDLSLSILTKTQEDGLQILEQILPVFNPEYTVSIKTIPGMDIVQDVPIILNSVSLMDEYDGDFTMRRQVIHTLNFQMKVNLFGSVTQPGNVILKTNVGLDSNGDGIPDETHRSEGDLDTREILFDGWE